MDEDSYFSENEFRNLDEEETYLTNSPHNRTSQARRITPINQRFRPTPSKISTMPLNRNNPRIQVPPKVRNNDDIEDDDDATVDVELENENALLKRRICDLEASNSAIKRSKKVQSTAMCSLIKTTVKQTLWRTVKFLTSPAQQEAFVEKVWDNLDIDSAYRESINKYEWKVAYSAYCCKALNEQRSYVVSRIRDAAFDILNKGVGTLPTFGQVYGCAQRKTAPKSRDTLVWYTDILLAKGAGHRHGWNKQKRCFYGPSKCCFGTQVSKLHIPASTEAFCCVVWECFRDTWIAQHEFMEANTGESIPVPRAKKGEVVPEDMRKYLSKYTQLDAGSSPMGGWSNAGMTRYNTICNTIIQARKTPAYAEAETEILPSIREKNEVTQNTYEEYMNKTRRTQPTAVPQVQEIAFAEEE